MDLSKKMYADEVEVWFSHFLWLPLLSFKNPRGGGGWRGLVFRQKLCHNKNAPTAALSLACLEIRSRNEEAINSTRNRIYSLKVSYSLLYRRRVFFRIFTFYLFLN